MPAEVTVTNEQLFDLIQKKLDEELENFVENLKADVAELLNVEYNPEEDEDIEESEDENAEDDDDDDDDDTE